MSAAERFFDLAAGDMPNMNVIDTGSVANLVVRLTASPQTLR